LDDKVIRIVSARKANTKESGVYPVRKPPAFILGMVEIPAKQEHRLLIERGKALPFQTGLTGGDAMRRMSTLRILKDEALRACPCLHT